MERIIVALSGGMASAWCADWALKNYSPEKVVLYFNDTKWEHPDLYRFLDELESFWNHPIIRDSDGRTPEQVFFDRHFLGNSRLAICSRILKAERLQNFYLDGDTLIFGIDISEIHRAERLIGVYQSIAIKRNKYPTLRFPLIEENITKDQVNTWLYATGIKRPTLYDLGFLHNNCSGGCVRAGKKHWAHLLKTLPDIYADRERMEAKFQKIFGEKYTILKDETLSSFRSRIQKDDVKFTEEDSGSVECIGICDLID